MDQNTLRAMCTSVAGRYALALFEIAQQRNMLEKTEEECSVALRLFSSRHAYRFLLIRILQGHVSLLKEKEFEKIAQFQDFFFRFLKLLVQNDRLGALKDIVRLFNRLADEAQNRISLKVFSADLLSLKQQKSIFLKLERIFKKNLYITCEINPHILGGIIVQSDLLTVDISVRHQIEKFVKESQEYFTVAKYGE